MSYHLATSTESRFQVFSMGNIGFILAWITGYLFTAVFGIPSLLAFETLHDFTKYLKLLA